ncbi:hypothetical protein [Methylomonas koyamae]|uniref:hypothetical protein n=1 Tax=Methylomonas koyamae TaxID=702114 RepID=UPI0006D09911|nr:hypothetical protein [Methylomonas koyamae]
MLDSFAFLLSGYRKSLPMAAWLNGICAEAMAKPAVNESVAKLDPRLGGKRLLAGRRNVSQITQVLWKSLFLT